MVAPRAGARIEEIAHDLFDVITHLWLATPRPRRRSNGLKEIEFLTLAVLHERGTMIVGDIQRLLNVLPAQMSRVIRALENRPRPLITCRINPQDKRKIDVCMTDFGNQALQDYQSARLQRIVELLQDLPEEDKDHLVSVLDKVRTQLARTPTLFSVKN
jgi:DNA-binding MarR family transcriptional regulator